MRITWPLLALFVALLSGCPRKQEPPAAPSPAGAAPGEAALAEERCVDAYLTSRQLDRYGAPEGTAYTGGTPLFDERTGETQDRLTYVYARQPGAAAACRRDR
jgi:hypothetical protein